LLTVKNSSQDKPQVDTIAAGLKG